MCFLCKQLLNLTVFTPPHPARTKSNKRHPQNLAKFAMTSGTVNKPWPFSTCSAGAGLAAPAAPVAEPGITSVHGCTCFCCPLEVLWHYSEKMDIASKLDGIFDDLCFCSDFFVINLLHRLKFWGGSCFGMFTITVLSILRHHFTLSRRTFVVRTSSNAKNGGALYVSEFVSTIIIENRKH